MEANFDDLFPEDLDCSLAVTQDAAVAPALGRPQVERVVAHDRGCMHGQGVEGAEASRLGRNRLM